ncbi:MULTISPECIES: hypothetical protein [Arsenicicoccus]|uniref:hypothetical protein n=1 Tax=Arsenicicoccus TaxID=267408 RepID=UPI0004924AE9|nr:MULTISPECIES: hypothetical protein [Arsenicicoccus]
MTRHDWLVGQGRWRWGDLLRLVAAVTVPLAWTLHGGPAAAAMFLVLGGAMALRFVDADTPTDLVAQVVLLASGWWAAAGTYDQVRGLDLVAHAGCGAVIALLLLHLPTRRPRPALGTVMSTTLAVLLLGVIWELGEWAGHLWVDPAIHVTYADSLTDLVADGVGGLVAALVATRVSRPASERSAAGSAGTPRRS